MRVSRTSHSKVPRCPACGHPLGKAGLSRCPLCGAGFQDKRATGADETPYAQARAQGERGWTAMGKWVWLAGGERLKHLALVRASVSSRHFAWVNMALLALGLTVLQVTRYEWRLVPDAVELEAKGAAEPTGEAWLHVATTPASRRQNLPGEANVDLWWNPLQAAIAAGFGFVAALVLMWVAMDLVSAGVTRAHRPPFRSEQRMSAALHYSTALALPLVLAAMLGAFTRLATFAEVWQWASFRRTRPIAVLAAVIGGFGVIMWWFWLVRLSTTAPANTRNRVVVFLAVGAPLILGAAAAAWWFGLGALHRNLCAALQLEF